MNRVDRSAAIKDRIRRESARLFSERGYAATGIRDIAAAAGVNSTIVVRHFGSKADLFVETLSLPDRWVEIMNGPVDDLPERMLGLIFASKPRHARGRGAFSAMLRASDLEEVKEKLRDSIDALLVQPLAHRLEGPAASLRAHLFASAVIGILTSAWVIEEPTIVDADADDLAEHFGPALHAILQVNDS